MECPKCKTQTYIDRVTPEGKYVYVCINPQCELYRKAQTLTGEDKETTIKTE